MNEFNDTFEARFWAKVAKTDKCWNWTAYTDPEGYGKLGTGKSATVYVHRASWELHYGPIPEGMMVLHQCDNPSCVRPDHLELGDHQKNMDQKVARGRASSRKAFLKEEISLFHKMINDGMSRLELSRRSGVDYGTLLRVLSAGYVGRDEITLKTLTME